MGFDLGGSFQTGSSNTQYTGSGNQTPTFTGGQQALQGNLLQVLQALLPGASSGSLSPNVQNMETANANQINSNFNGMQKRVNNFLAARGFGKSGAVGSNDLQTELGRQSALASNASAASGQQLGLDTTLLSDALQFAFSTPGQTSTVASNQNQTASQGGFSAGASI